MPLAAIVSDDTALLIEISQTLDLHGWAVLTVRESTAVASIKREHPDLIIFDMRPERPEAGWQVLELLRKEPSTRDIPILVTTTRSDENPERREIGTQVAILYKPFSPDELLRAMERALHPPRKTASSS